MAGATVDATMAEAPCAEALVGALAAASDAAAFAAVLAQLEALAVTGAVLQATRLPRVLSEAVRRVPDAATGARAAALKERWRGVFRRDVAQLRDPLRTTPPKLAAPRQRPELDDALPLAALKRPRAEVDEAGGSALPRSFTGKAAALATTRTASATPEEAGAALAECIMRVAGPPRAAQSAQRTRDMLTWLARSTRQGPTEVFGRSVAYGDVKAAARHLGRAWSRELSAKTARPGLPIASGAEAAALDAGVGSAGSGGAAAAQRLKRPRSRSPCSSSSSGSSSSSSSGSDSEPSDLSDEEAVDSEAEVEEKARGQQFVDWNLPLPEDGYRGDWRGAPELGTAGFIDFAVRAMRKAGVAAAPASDGLDARVACPPLQPHQETAVFLLHPKSPVSRLLVDHPTGAGKTREMIQVLDSFFYDPRPKVPIFPKEPVCRNFYAELLRWPNKYREYFSCLRPHCAARASCSSHWRLRREHMWNLNHLTEPELRSICSEMREVLEMKGCFYMGRMLKYWKQDFKRRFPRDPFPAAPLRALRYTSAGGRHAALREADGLPASALFKIGFNHRDPNVYSRKIVVMDEVHNLVRTQTQFGEQLSNLRTLLHRAKGAVLAGFTATPILCEPQEGRQLLDIIKGFDAPLGDAGFISSFHMRPAALFPRSLPQGVPDGVLVPKLRRNFVKKVTLLGEALQRYDKKRAAGLPPHRLQRYCSLCVHFGAMHDGKNGCKARVLDDLESCAPKLFAIANDVAAEASKALVLVARSSGMDALVGYLRRLGGFGVATMEELADFNAPENVRGERYRVLVADSTTCSEGVSFFGVRRILLADVPSTHSGLVQSVGRAVRMYGHRGLPEEEWTVTTTLYVAKLPPWLQSPLGAWAYRTQRHHQDPKVGHSKARRLLRRLRRVGLHSLEDLRARLAEEFPELHRAALAHAEAAAAQAAAPGSPAAVFRGAVSPPRRRMASDADAETPRASQSDAEDVASTPRSARSAVSPPRRRAASDTDAETPRAPQSDAEDVASTPRSARSVASSPCCARCVDASPSSRLASDFDASSVEASPRKGGLAERSGPGEEPAAKAARPRLQPKDAAAFLESIGLRDEAKLLATWSSERPAARRPGKSARRAPSGGGEARAPQHWLVRALQWLLESPSEAEAAARLRLGASTADEEAVRALAAMSRLLVPALQELRREAVDREVLSALGAQAAPQGDSEGESSAPEFFLSDASSGEDLPEGPPPLVLPPGWQVQRVRRGKGKGKGTTREYVDPAGNVYKTEAQARRVVDAGRRTANMASRLRERFGAKFAVQPEGAGSPAPEVACH